MVKVEVKPIVHQTYLDLNLQEFYIYFHENRKIQMNGFEICNFRKHVNEGLPPFSFELEQLVANIPWEIHFLRKTYDNKEYLNIGLVGHCAKPTRHVTNIGIVIPHSTDASKNIQQTVRGYDIHPNLRYHIGSERDEGKLIDKLTKEGYILKNGSLAIFVALEVVCMINEPYLPMWNFYDEANFDANKVFIFKFSDGRCLYADKRILCRHSEMLAEHIKVKRLKTIDVDDEIMGPEHAFWALENTLQVAYGVRRKSQSKITRNIEMAGVMVIATTYGMESIYRICENHWLHDEYQQWKAMYMCNMPKIAKQILKNVDTVGKMKEMLSICDSFNLMPTEVKRIVMQKIYGLRNSI